jgi:hypothetical protein
MKFYLKLEFMLILIIKFNFTKLLLKNLNLLKHIFYYIAFTQQKKINGLLIQMLNFCIYYLV